MEKTLRQKLEKKIRNWIILFIVLLILSGITAFPLEWELSLLADFVKDGPPLLKDWIIPVYEAIRNTNAKYPFMSYGTDWLAFAHIVIATAFIGPLRDPVKNIWVIQFGMIACIMVLPLAFIAGSIREIPFYWQLVDCSFGIFGFIPLWICQRDIKQLEKLKTIKKS